MVVLLWRCCCGAAAAVVVLPCSCCHGGTAAVVLPSLRPINVVIMWEFGGSPQAYSCYNSMHRDALKFLYANHLYVKRAYTLQYRNAAAAVHGNKETQYVLIRCSTINVLGTVLNMMVFYDVLHGCVEFFLCSAARHSTAQHSTVLN